MWVASGCFTTAGVPHAILGTNPRPATTKSKTGGKPTIYLSIYLSISIYMYIYIYISGPEPK